MTSTMYELSGAELDAVAAGQGGVAGQAGLVNVGVFVQDVLNDNFDNANIEILNDNNTNVVVGVGAGVAVAILGAAAAGGSGIASRTAGAILP